MNPPVLIKYGFRIRTRVGMVVESLMIHGRNREEAEAKLKQMYRDCEVLDCVCHLGASRVPAPPPPARVPPPSFERVMDMLTR